MESKLVICGGDWLLHLGRVEKVSITWSKFHTIGSIVSFDQESSTIAKIYQNWKLLDDAQIKHIGCKKVKFRKSIFESISWGGGAVSLLYAKTFEHHKVPFRLQMTKPRISGKWEHPSSFDSSGNSRCFSTALIFNLFLLISMTSSFILSCLHTYFVQFCDSCCQLRLLQARFSYNARLTHSCIDISEKSDLNAK